jgi:hypothetical protein
VIDILQNQLSMHCLKQRYRMCLWYEKCDKKFNVFQSK